MNLVSQEIKTSIAHRPSKEEILLDAIQQAISTLYDAAGSAGDSNEVENYLQAAKPLTDALIACIRLRDRASE